MSVVVLVSDRVSVQASRVNFKFIERRDSSVVIIVTMHNETGSTKRPAFLNDLMKAIEQKRPLIEALTSKHGQCLSTILALDALLRIFTPEPSAHFDARSDREEHYLYITARPK